MYLTVVPSMSTRLPLAVVAVSLLPVDGHTLGMRAADTSPWSTPGPGSPRSPAAAARSVLSVLFFITFSTAYTYVLGHYDTPLNLHRGQRARPRSQSPRSRSSGSCGAGPGGALHSGTGSPELAVIEERSPSWIC